MQNITEEELAARLDFRRPLHPEPEKKESVWCIPFEYGSNAKGTCISIAKAKEISAELRAAVAEAEKRELYRAFKVEEERNAFLREQCSAAENAKFTAMSEAASLKATLRKRKRRALDKRER